MRWHTAFAVCRFFRNILHYATFFVILLCKGVVRL